jgi:hypothetical protein
VATSFLGLNPVASSHFNFSLLEPTGVVSILAPETSGLIGLVILYVGVQIAWKTTAGSKILVMGPFNA